MDSTINKIILAFVILVIFDATSFEKKSFGMLSSAVKTVAIVKNTAKALKWN